MNIISLFQVSLLASFAAGMVALFAPCCISFLLPSYFGNVFKEKRQVLFMTFIYSLGIFTIMLPIVLGARALSLFFFRFHDQSYLVGGIFLLLISFVTLLGIKLPMPKISINQKPGKPDIGSTYLLGLFSGVTSACCAPVLLGVMSLSAFSFSFIGSLGVSLAYVLGMVFPLYIGSYFIDKKNLLNIPFLRKRLYQLSIMGKKYDILATNLIGFLIFLIMGSLIIILASLGKLGMPEDQSGFISVMTNIAEKLTNLSQAIPGLDLLFAVLIVFIIIKLLNFSQRKNEK
jgi:cytochrome c biogenesis protein CcdA